MSRAAGNRFERLAAQYLTRLGFRVLAANYVCRGGELDLVCDDAGTLVFVEVRARSGRHGDAAETISGLKQKRVVHAARHYLTTVVKDEVACRFDVVAITGDHVEHIRDAFDAG